MKLAYLERFRGILHFGGKLTDSICCLFGTSEENRVAVQSIGKELFLPERTGVVAQCAWGKDIREENLFAVFDEWENFDDPEDH